MVAFNLIQRYSNIKLRSRMSNNSVEKSYENLGFTVFPSFLTDEEQVKLLAYLDRSLSGSIDEGNLSIAERSRARKAGRIVAVSEQKYGREYYIQTDHFQKAVLDNDGCYSRTPSDAAKHSIPKETARLEDDRNEVIKVLSERIQLLPQIANEKLYLIQCVQYCGKFERGKHIDNKVNGGDIIVGCSIGPTERYIELSDGKMACKFTLSPGSLYVMKGKSRYEYFHDATRLNGTHPYAIVLRFGKFDISLQ